jgi:radical SAM protein with 4Fe4S-binding SPASM domain
MTELARVADEIAGMAPTIECVLSGGEPLLHPDAREFGERMKAHGNTVSLLTNGTLINASNAKRITSFADRIKISLDGSTEELHAKTRGKRNHSAVVAAIDLLIESGANVQVAMTVHRGNRIDIEAMAARYGSRLVFQPLFRAGRGAKLNNLVLTGEEYYEALASAWNVAPMGSMSSVLERLRGRGSERCAMADAEISISETGDVYPCQMLALPEFVAGNIRQQSLSEIYHNSQTLRKARSISIRTLEKCRDCPIRRLCAGGCRARDYHEIGTIEAVGDFCEYEQRAFMEGLFDSVALDRVVGADGARTADPAGQAAATSAP